MAHPSRPWSNVLRDLPPEAFAAWCWRRSSPDHYVAYVVGPHGEMVALNMSTEGTPPLPGLASIH
jgi:hypothetical protein